MDCVAPPSKGGRRNPSVTSSRFLVAKGGLFGFSTGVNVDLHQLWNSLVVVQVVPDCRLNVMTCPKVWRCGVVCCRWGGGNNHGYIYNSFHRNGVK